MKWTIILGILLITALFSGCTSKQEELPATATNSVDIKNLAFNPATITISEGTTVTWTNSDTASHTVTGNSGNELDSLELKAGQTFSHTFMEAGTYYYQCKIHASMRGIIIVT